MKKGHIVLLIFSIITTILAILAFAFSTMFFNLANEGAQDGQAGAEVLGLLFYIIFNAFTFITATVNFILNLVQFIKIKKVYTIILFVLACLILIASVGMFIYILIPR